MTPPAEVLEWLLGGDVAVRWQTRRDLLKDDQPELQQRIAREGHGAALLAARGPDGHWGRGFYQPKWTSTHYTLLELKEFGLPPDNAMAQESVGLILSTELGRDGGLNPSPTIPVSDVCINGMGIAYSAYFGAATDALAGLVDFLLGRQLPDGGFNCRFGRDDGVTHSSVHSSISVLEGLTEYVRAGHIHRLEEVVTVMDEVVTFFLRHRLLRSERTGEVIRPEFTRLHHPARWHFDVLRGLDAFRSAEVSPDGRLDDALELLRHRRTSDGRWRAAAPYPGQTHVAHDREAADRWVTLRALRVLQRYDDRQHPEPLGGWGASCNGV